MTLYACGSNGSGQLGLGNTEDYDQFTHVLHTPCPKLVGGGNHTLLIANGKALVSGQVGPINSTTFVALNHPQELDWVYAGAGWEHLVLADQYTVYTLGRGLRGELGRDSAGDGLTKIKTFKTPIAQISCGPTHTIVRLQNKELWGWGYNRHSPLGLKDKIVPLPTRLPLDADMVACGRDYSLILENTIVRGWGRRVAELEAEGTMVYAGWSFYGLENTTGVEWYGNNTFGQTNAPQNLLQLAVGSEHGIGIKDNSLVTWGWGEHGNCPPPFAVSEGAQVYGGCATTWVWVPENSRLCPAHDLRASSII